ncbi:MAG: hypothetical protein KKF85_03370 [Gammaproteobacteria bacterium]|nr:hypothetical protein [Rhodocyclaceae bacterium]MBU3908863.1 hypothetical protein [Gammaproteobacteria bacterium]MBU3987730.1 hypothetical protein [Gammaproteobacteria bacterium]MBU4021812.1 hypothetical protein [Gammaproteobacteria bacterium]MBU4096511.1 hypothetical protein [Gammaproteobacteria bacterium]
MADDNRASIVLDGDVGPLRRKLREAGDHLKQFGKEGEGAVSGMTGPLENLQSKFVAIGAILAGGAVFKEAVAQAALMTEESMKLGRALDLTAAEASVLREALEAGNTSQDEFMRAAQGLGNKLRENEDDLQALGLVTRNAAGELRPLNELTLDAIGLLGDFRSSTDRAVAAQTIFGRGFELTSNLARMNKEAVASVEEQMRSLGIVVSEESVKAWEAFDDAGDRATLTMKGFKTIIGNALMPVLTKLGEWFSDIGPAAVVVIRGAIGGLISLFWGLKTSATIAFQLINAAVVQLTEPIRAVSVAFWKLITGDFQGAKAEIANIPKVWSQTWNTAFDTIVDSAAEAREKIFNLFVNGPDAGKEKTGARSASGVMGKDGKAKAAKEAVDPSFMQYYEAELALRKNAFEQENTLRQFSKEQELAYWREIQQNLELTSKDRVNIAKRTAALELDIRRQSAKEQRDLDGTLIDSRRAAALAQIKLEEQHANFSRENGDISKRQLLEIEENFARRRFEIEYQALLERLELAKTDPNASPAMLMQIKEQMLEIERNYQLRRGEIMQGKQQEEGGLGGFFDGVGDSFGQMANSLLTSATTLRQALGSIFQGIYQSFVQNLITKPLGEWIASQARMLAVKLGFVAQEKAIETAAAASTVAIKGAETTAVVAANAAEAGSGAAASQASIPIVGPMLALAAMAAVFAAVMALGSKKSAARGYDIPKGINPMTQLHEEEMVLPSHLANVVRGMAGEGGAVSPAPTSVQNITISAVDARSFRDYLKSNSHALAPGLRQLARNFTPVKGR